MTNIITDLHIFDNLHEKYLKYEITNYRYRNKYKREMDEILMFVSSNKQRNNTFPDFFCSRSFFVIYL